MRRYIIDFLNEFEYPAEAVGCLLQAYDAICTGTDGDAVSDDATGRLADKADTTAVFGKLLDAYKADIHCDFKQLVAEMKGLSEAVGIHEYTGNLLLFICLTRRLKQYYTEAGIDLAIWYTSMLDLKWKNIECQLVHGIWGTFVPDWYTRFFHMTRFGFEKLQFETVCFGHYYEKNGITLVPDSVVLNVHIPRTGTRLDRDSLNHSYDLGREFYREQFEGHPIVFVCKSWMLYPKNLELLSEHSNLRAFMSDYDIIEQGEYPDYTDVWRLFDTAYTGDSSKLPGNSSLRRGYKSWIERGEKTGWGYGVSLTAGSTTMDRS